ncbi:DUF1592 domain-containing protein [Planctomicrobium sp. SH661]|uniref:DUF1592 domain-containing protein n=1 Tax=Planctomicrobium sp. SH661 TaxID=3448124 RepID=UPI003F5C9F9C
MNFRIAILICFLASARCSMLAASDVPQPVVPAQHLEQLRTHCQSCHSEEAAEAGFRVDDLPLEIDSLPVAQRWQKILNALNSGEMPPAGEPNLDAAAKANLLDDLAHTMVVARKSLSDQNGQITLRRLNRREYRNSLRELLGVEINVNDLPSDAGSGRFDTVGANLFMSGPQFEQYLALGREALDEAFEWHAAAAVEKKLHFEGEEITPKVEKFIERQLDAQQRARQWTQLVDAAVALPENAAIVEEIRKGPLGNHRHIFYRSWRKFPNVPAPETFGFKTEEDNADKAVTALSPFHLPYHRYYLEQPAVDRGAYLAIPNEHPAELDNATVNLLIPFDWPSGNYVVRLQVAITEHATPDRRFIEFGIDPRIEQPISAHEVTGTIDSPQLIEFPLTITRGNRERANRSMFLREIGTRDHYPHTLRIADAERRANNNIGRTFALWVDWMEIERVPNSRLPVPPGMSALTPVLVDDKTPVSASEVRPAIERFAVEAFRGVEPAPDYIDRLVSIYDEQRQAGIKQSDALKETLAIVLSSPQFLYLGEPQNADGRRKLCGQELACRLSFFLWSAPPDAELRGLAKSEELLQPEILRAQTERLLNDPRAFGFIKSFADQWLGLERLDFFQVNLERHPRFTNMTRLNARQEIYETIKHLFANNAPLSDLLMADYVIVNALMANYYGIEGVHGDEFRKVPVPADSPRGGLLGMAAVHLMGGNGDNSSPVERGAWVLRKLLHDPPPPAPANVPQLARLAGKALTTRERLIAHQDAPQCNSCHRKIDPIGFGLENFDGVGAWRTEDFYQVIKDNGQPDPQGRITWTIDPSSKLYHGPEFKDFFELRELIAAHRDDFVQGYSEALIEFGLGRPAGFSDQPLIDSMVQHARENRYAVRDFVHTLIQSQEFQSK